MAVDVDGLLHCIHCGAGTDADQRFCPYCGTRLKGSVYDEAYQVEDAHPPKASSAGRNPMYYGTDLVSRGRFLASLDDAESDEGEGSMTHWGREMQRAERALEIAADELWQATEQAQAADEDAPEDGETSEYFSASAQSRVLLKQEARAVVYYAQEAYDAAVARRYRLIAEAEAVDTWFRLSGDGPPVGPWNAG